MVSLRKLREKSVATYKYICDRYLRYKSSVVQTLTPIISTLIKTYRAITQFCYYLLKIILFISEKTWAALQYLYRRLYVWKVLSVRRKWYLCKEGSFYNPKLKATIYPTWHCTWNLSWMNDNYSGIDSKESAQDIAFKLWMKKRNLKNRLGLSEIKMNIPVNLSHRILPNKIYIRKASTKDAPELLKFMEQLGYSQEDETLTARIQTYAYSTNNHILIAERGKQIIGFVAFIIYDLFSSRGKRCHIEELCTGSGPTDLSIKRKLMEAVENFARDNDGKIIDLTVGSCQANDVTNDFYKFLGYDNENITTKRYMKKEL